MPALALAAMSLTPFFVFAMVMDTTRSLDLLSGIGTAPHHATRAGLTFPVSRVARHLKQVCSPQQHSIRHKRDRKHATFRTVTKLSWRCSKSKLCQ